MNKENGGYIYILTNPSFPEWVKIGYADNVKERVDTLNRTECTPFAFRIYATYKVAERLKDLDVQDMIDIINPQLRSIDNVDGKIRKREFYSMSPEDAYSMFEKMAKVHGCTQNLIRYSKTKDEKDDEKIAEHVEELARNRHHFREIEFTSSLTGKKYIGKTNDQGTLAIIETESGNEIANNSKPSKKAIIGQAIVDYGGSTTKDETLYQRYRKLTKLILENK